MEDTHDTVQGYYVDCVEQLEKMKRSRSRKWTRRGNLGCEPHLLLKFIVELEAKFSREGHVEPRERTESAVTLI